MIWLLTATTVATAVMFLVLLFQHYQLARNQRQMWDNFIEVLSSGSGAWNSMVEALTKKEKDRDEEVEALKKEIAELKGELNSLKREERYETPMPSPRGQEIGYYDT